MTPQAFASIARQVIALAAVVMGALTSAVSAIHLPPAVSAVIAGAGAVIFALEHYLSDPSTGTTSGSAAPVSGSAAPAPAPAPPPPPPGPAVVHAVQS